MTSTQAPKGFGILFVLVGIPLILWNAAGTSDELDALNAKADTGGRRIEQCVANTAGLVSDPSLRRHVCECVVAKATARGALADFGGYDEAALDPIIGECVRGDWD